MAAEAKKLESDESWGIAQVTAYTGLSRTSVWRLCTAKRFPPPHYVLRDRTWWRSEVEAWMRENSGPKPTSLKELVKRKAPGKATKGGDR